MDEALKESRLRALSLADELVRRIEERKKSTDDLADDVLSAIREERVRELAEGSVATPPGSSTSDVRPGESG